MKFMLSFTLPPVTRDEAMARFLETQGQPPPGVTLLGRWTQCDLCGGFVLLESADPTALTAFAHAWSDLLERARARPRRAETDPSVPPETYPEDAPVAPETTPGTTKPPYEEIA